MVLRILLPTLWVLAGVACQPGVFDRDVPRARDAGAGGGDAGKAAAAGSGGSVGGAGGAGAGGPGAGGAGAGVAGAGEQASCERADPDRAVQLVGMHDLGSVEQPQAVALRVPGPITWIGTGKLVWLFPKTGLDGVSARAGAPSNHPSAAFVGRKEPGRLDEPLGADGLPEPFFAPAGVSPDVELWPTALLRLAPDDQGEATTGAVVIVQRVAADFSYDVLSTRVAVDALSTQEPLTPLFMGNDPRFSLGAYRGGEFGYLYACSEDTAVADRADPQRYPCKVARAPVTELDKREAWRAYHTSDKQWATDLTSAEPVLFGASNSLSVSHHSYLGRYLAVHSRWFSNEIVVQSGERPWGPWRVELTIKLPAPPAGVVQFALEQPSLASAECESAIYISYLWPLAADSVFPSRAEIRLLKVDLK